MDEEVSGFRVKYSGSGCTGRTTGGTKCGRWNPTAEQVKVLTDLFTSGLRTPSTDQIQKISSQLSFYGKIESKNVFYWFQNHKARERQKRRRISSVQDRPHHHHHHHHQQHCHQIDREPKSFSSSKCIQTKPTLSIKLYSNGDSTRVVWRKVCHDPNSKTTSKDKKISVYSNSTRA
ncbi:hypothetical protein Scep_015036 [Stephania cephalantha]|uniref:Homeobox domain-containing protein n=1 Tax=Stephania cephalantha TaxID=152367 RepID=A0AAP0P2E4_9MAGN